MPGKVDLVYKGSLIADMQLFKRVVASAAVMALAVGNALNVLTKKKIKATANLRIFLMRGLLHL
jgi:hypothetical protein